MACVCTCANYHRRRPTPCAVFQDPGVFPGYSWCGRLAEPLCAWGSRVLGWMKPGGPGAPGFWAAEAQGISPLPAPHPNCLQGSFPDGGGFAVLLAVPWCGAYLSPVHVAFGGGCLFHLLVWTLVRFCWLIFLQSCSSFSPLPPFFFPTLFLQVFLLNLVLGSPWSCLSCFRRFGLHMEEEGARGVGM